MKLLPYEQYPGEYAGSFASDLGWFASILIALPDVDREFIEDVLVNSSLIREIETTDNPTLANSTFYTWIALLRREQRYQQTPIGDLDQIKIRNAINAPTCWSLWWSVEAAARIAQGSYVRISNVLDVISLKELEEKFYPSMHTLPFAKIFDAYKARTQER